MAGRHGKRAEVILAAALDRRDEVGQRVERLLPFSLPLLPQRVETAFHLAAGFVGVNEDVVALARGRPEAVHAPGREQLFADDPLEQRLGIVEQLARGFAEILDPRRSSDTFP